VKTDAGATIPPAVARAAATQAKRPGSRSAFVRTKVPGIERVISILILCLLVCIGVAVWYAGRHFDPSIFSLPDDALNSTTAAVTGKAGTLRADSGQESDGAAPKLAQAAIASPSSVPSTAAAAPGGEDDASASFSADAVGAVAAPAAAAAGNAPLEINFPGIKPMGDTEFYTADTLYEKIDGRSPAYQSFNFQQLRCRTFSIDGGSSYVDVAEYRMDTNVDAIGIFAQERDPKGQALPFAKDGYSSEMGYFFRQGNVYVQVIASDENPKTMAIALAIAQNRAKVLPADDSGLDGRRALPGAGLVAGSITFVQQDAQGQDFLKNVFQGTYDFEGAKLTYFVMATTPDASASAWKAYLDFCGQFGGKASVLPDIAGAKVFKAATFGTYKVIYQRGGQIGGIVDATDPKPALDFVTQYLRGQIQ